MPKTKKMKKAIKVIFLLGYLVLLSNTLFNGLDTFRLYIDKLIKFLIILKVNHETIGLVVLIAGCVVVLNIFKSKNQY